MVYVFTRVLRFPDNTIIAWIKDNYHEQGNIIIILILLPLGHISNSISAGVLSILQSRPQTIFDKPPCAIIPLLHGICFFFVNVCVFSSCYWAVIVSFIPPFANRAIHFHLVAIATFGWTAQITFFLRVFCAVPPKCHTGNVFTFPWDCRKGDWFCYPPHPTPCLIFSNKEISPKERS